MQLDVGAARTAVDGSPDRSGSPLEEAAAGIVHVNNHAAATLIRQRTLEQGLDPRDFVVYAYGGAGPLHAFGFAAELGATGGRHPARQRRVDPVGVRDRGRRPRAAPRGRVPRSQPDRRRGTVRRGRGRGQAAGRDGRCRGPTSPRAAHGRADALRRAAAPRPVPVGSGGVSDATCRRSGLRRRVRAPVRRVREGAVPGGRGVRGAGPRPGSRRGPWAGDGARAPARQASRTGGVLAGRRTRRTPRSTTARSSPGDTIDGPAVIELAYTTIPVPRAATPHPRPRTLLLRPGRSAARPGSEASTHEIPEQRPDGFWDGVARVHPADA